MEEYLKRVFATTILGICLIFALVSLGSCGELPEIEVLFSPEQGEEILHTLKGIIQNAEE